jgi:hypothetical protein
VGLPVRTVGTAYEQLRAMGPPVLVVHTGDTGWRVAGVVAFLLPFETQAVTVQQVRPRHLHEPMQEVISKDYTGAMATDRGRRYDAWTFDGCGNKNA